MAFAVRKLSNEPIVIVTVAMPLDRYPHGVRMVNRQIARFATCDSPLYCILDTRSLDLSYSDMLLWLAEQGRSQPGSICDTRIRPIIVGDHPLLYTTVKKAHQRLGVELLHFTTLNEALAYTRRLVVAEVVA